MIRNHILVDIDHTLSNAFPRDGMIGASSWDEYHAASVNDEPLHDMVDLIRALAMQGSNIIGFTARPAKWRRITMEWMHRGTIPLHELLMREDEDYRPSVEMKLALARSRFKDDNGIRDNVAFLLEDRDDVVAAFRALGVTVLQVFGRQR